MDRRGDGEKYFLIGETLPYSFSPELHALFLKELFGNEAPEYGLRELAPAQLESFFAERDFCGINVTIPYKQAVIQYLDFLDGRAERIGAVNTVVNRQGRLCGYNTDFDGLMGLVETNQMVLKGQKVLILGTGGTSRTAQVVAEELGAKEIYKVTHSPKPEAVGRAAKGSDSAREGNSEKEGSAEKSLPDCPIVTYDEAEKYHGDASVIINTTPCGMYPNLRERPMLLRSFRRLKGVIDVIYNPLRSNLVLEARKRKIKAAGGLYMLVAQAAAAEQLFFNIEIPKDTVYKVFRRLLFEKENLVFSGMPGCGKSTLSRKLGEITGRRVADIDAIIVKEGGASIEEIFANKGEAGFRSVESRMIARVAGQQGKIIALGGGAVLKPQNVWELKRNGRIIFLDKDVKDIKAVKGRPLTATVEALEQKYAERYHIYRGTCDERIRLSGSREDNLETILTHLGIEPEKS